MQDILTMMTQLRRPRLLIRAAKLGADEYRREQHLQRLLGYGALPRSATALLRLMEMEQVLNTQRKEDDGAYTLTRHLDLMIAMMGEARILRASQIERLGK